MLRPFCFTGLNAYFFTRSTYLVSLATGCHVSIPDYTIKRVQQ